MHAQQIPGGAPPTLPIPMHPSLGGAGPGGPLSGLPNNGNGPTPTTPQQLAMLTKQELMLHSRPEDGGAGKSGPNDENRHVRNFFLLFLNYYLLILI